MQMILQQYDNGKWGYKGIDDVPDENMLKGRGIGEDCKVLNEQQSDEDREAFFQRIGVRPGNKEYGSDENFDKQIIDNKENHIYIADEGYGLDKLINDKDPWVRIVVTRQKYGLDKLINDEDYRVRKAVVRQGYGLDKLINDQVWQVRADVYEYICKNNKYQKYVSNILNEKDIDCIETIICRLTDSAIMVQIKLSNIKHIDVFRQYFKIIYYGLDEIKNNQEYMNKLKNDIVKIMQQFGSGQFMHWIYKICDKLNWKINISVE